MTDTVAQYLIQFTTVTAGGMALSEWLPFKIGTPGSTRKRYSHLAYNLGLSSLGTAAGLVKLPGDSWYANLAGLVLLSILSTALAHVTVVAGKSLTKLKGQKS